MNLDDTHGVGGALEAHLAAAKERAEEYADWFLTNAPKDGVEGRKP